MYIWTSAEVEQILIELDAKKLPFKKYTFAKLGSGLSYLGRGGFSVVYEGKKRSQCKATYAIKVIGFGDKHVDSQFFRSSIRTQKALGKLNECVITVYDYVAFYVWLDEENHVSKVQKVYRWTKELVGENYLKLQFICMEKQDAVLYNDPTGKQKLTPEGLAVYEEQEVLKIGAMIGRALYHTHRRKVLHRDIKLENLFYDSRKKQYKLGDYGIAKVTVDGAASTVAFTKGYGAPEVVGSLDEKYDETADIYSLGMVLYVLMNDRKFPGSKDYYVNVGEQYQKGYVLEQPSNGSDSLFAIVKKMCYYNPDERYQTMEEVLEDLENEIFYGNSHYKRKHKLAQLMVGIISFALGVFILQNPNMQLEVFGRVLLLERFEWLALTNISISFSSHFRFLLQYGRSTDW
ncbi:MAG: protein kinase [Eubacteriales bacterium]